MALSGLPTTGSCLSYAGGPRARCSGPGGVSQGQSRWAESPPSPCWLHFFWCNPWYTWFSQMQVSIAETCWASCWPTALSTFFQGFSQSILHPTCTYSWDSLSRYWDRLTLGQACLGSLSPGMHTRPPTFRNYVNHNSMSTWYTVHCMIAVKSLESSSDEHSLIPPFQAHFSLLSTLTLDGVAGVRDITMVSLQNTGITQGKLPREKVYSLHVFWKSYFCVKSPGQILPSQL